MPRTTKPVATQCRLNLAVSEEVRRRLEELQVASEADSMTEVFRRALAVYEALWKARSSGASIVIRDGDKEREIMLL